MITDSLYSLVFLSLMVLGVRQPIFAISLVAWVDILKPQNLSFSFLAGKPLSLLAAGFFFMSLILNKDKISIPKSKAFLFLYPLFAFWITVATFRAEFQSLAFIKYDVAIKTLVVVYFIPFVLNSRLKIETFLFVCISCFGMFISMGGLKTFLGGGGYGLSLVGNGGFMYSEGSMLSTLSVCLIPLYFYFFKYSQFSKSYPVIKYVFLCYIFASLLTLIGTQARTGLVALLAFICLEFVYSKSKFKLFLVVLLCSSVLLPFVTDGFKARMASIEESTTTEKSAVGRIVVWRWTLDYVSHRPFFGGGFFSYNANAGVLHHYQNDDEVPIVQETGKAFHNIFFEVLGETGYGGLLLFLWIIFLAVLQCLRTYNLSMMNPEMDWLAILSRSCMFSLAIYCTGGLFINVAFYPWIYFLSAVSVSLLYCREVPAHKVQAKRLETV